MVKLPTEAPPPRPAPKHLSDRAKQNPKGLRVRMEKLLSENWENCHPKYWEFQPDHRFRFRADAFECMEGENVVTDKEIQVFYQVYDLTGKKMKAANLLRMPYALAEWLIKQRELRLREDEEFEERLEQDQQIRYIMGELEDDDLAWD